MSVAAAPPRARLQEYLREHLDSQLQVEAMTPLTGGASNHMFLLETRPLGRLVLRRPPAVKSSPTAHDVAREHRVLTALEGTSVPHPRAHLLCSDAGVIGAPFLLMEHVEGFVLDGSKPPPGGGAARLDELAGMFIDGLAELASVDWQAVGLSGFGRPQGFLERQVDRWLGQLEGYRARPLPLLDFLPRWLADNRPPEGDPGILHGDYQFLNVIFAPSGDRVAAIVDWEQSTIGDPLLDLGWVLGLWAQPGERSPVSQTTWLSQAPGMPRRQELAARYAARTGRQLGHLNYYEVLALFKLACVLEGSYSRHLSGVSEHGVHADFGWMVPRLLETAAAIARGERD
jgi:aminoglycoside phosphotransferase (APT) family kinase protein